MEHTSYLPLADQFLAHWALMDAKVGAPGVSTAAGVSRAGFLALRNGLAAGSQVVTRAENTVEFSRAKQLELRGEVYERLGQLRASLLGWWGKVAIGGVMPVMPAMTYGLEKFLLPARDGLRLWEKVDAAGSAPSGITLPLRLGVALDFARGDFASLVAALVAEGLATEAAELELRLARWERGALERRLRAAMVDYRQAAKARLRTADAEWASLPKLG